MTPLECAARALCFDREPDYAGGGMHPTGIEIDAGIAWWTGYVEQVRAVLTAIREPSDKVALATASKVFDISSAQDEMDMGASCWRAGIDAMLEDG